MNPKEMGGIPSFEVQFLAREELRFGDKRIGVLDISPQNPKRVVLFIPGWNASIDKYFEPIQTLFDRNRRVISAEIVGTEDEKASEIEQILDSKELNDTDLIAHSVGALSSAIAAFRNPQRIRRVVLLNPASMIGQDSEKELIRRYSDLMKEEQVDRLALGNMRKIYDMARTITSFDMYGILKSLKEKGVGVRSIHSLGDKLFPHEKIEGEARRQNWDKPIFVDGGHLSIGGLIPHALELLEELDKTR